MKKKKKEAKLKKFENMSVLGVIAWFFHFLAKAFLYSVFFIFLCIIGVFIVYFADQVINIRQNRPPLLHAYIIVSPSMVPAINVNDAILVKRREPEELEIGSIITYISTDPRYYGLTVTHRVVGINIDEDGRHFFTTQGDANNVVDATSVTGENLIGEVIFRMPRVGRLQQFLLNIWGWIALIVVPSITVIVYDVVKLVGSMKRKNKEDEDIEIITDEIDQPVEKLEDTNEAVLESNDIEENTLKTDDVVKPVIESDDDIEIL